MATPLTRAEWLDECAKLAKTYEEAMTDEAKATSDHILAASVVGIRQSKKVQWTPQEDITAYELALCIPLLASQNLWYPEDYIPEGCERHFKVTDK